MVWEKWLRRTEVQRYYFSINILYMRTSDVTLYNKWLAKSFPSTPFPVISLFRFLLQAAGDRFYVPDAMNYSVKGAL